MASNITSEEHFLQREHSRSIVEQDQTSSSNMSESERCVICQSRAVEPLQCGKCKNCFCRQCAITWRKIKNQCPLKCHSPPWKFLNVEIPMEQYQQQSSSHMDSYEEIQIQQVDEEFEDFQDVLENDFSSQIINDIQNFRQFLDQIRRIRRLLIQQQSEHHQQQQHHQDNNHSEQLSGEILEEEEEEEGSIYLLSSQAYSFEEVQGSHGNNNNNNNPNSGGRRSIRRSQESNNISSYQPLFEGCVQYARSVNIKQHFSQHYFKTLSAQDHQYGGDSNGSSNGNGSNSGSKLRRGGGGVDYFTIEEIPQQEGKIQILPTRNQYLISNFKDGNK